MRSTTAPATNQPVPAEPLVAQITVVIDEFPTYGYRRVYAILIERNDLTVNRKKVYQLIRQRRWLIT